MAPRKSKLIAYARVSTQEQADSGLGIAAQLAAIEDEFGTPDEVIAKLRRYEALGVDEFIYYASLGLGLEEQKRSMQLFCDEVIPAFI